MTRIPLLSSHGLSSWFSVMFMLIYQSTYGESKPISQHISKSTDFAKCQNISRELIKRTSEVLSNMQSVENDIYCSYETINAEDITSKEVNTWSACLPRIKNKNSVCQEINRSAIEEETCLKAIHSDLNAFRKELQNLSPDLNDVIKDLMKALKVQDEEEEDGDGEIKSPNSSYGYKYNQCAILLSFNLRAVTIARVLNYLKDEPKHNDTNKQ